MQTAYGWVPPPKVPLGTKRAPLPKVMPFSPGTVHIQWLLNMEEQRPTLLSLLGTALMALPAPDHQYVKEGLCCEYIRVQLLTLPNPAFLSLFQVLFLGILPPPQNCLHKILPPCLSSRRPNLREQEVSVSLHDPIFLISFLQWSQSEFCLLNNHPFFESALV